MYLTEQEIFSQYSALERTYQYFIEQAECIENFFRKHRGKSLFFIGCGSSYFQCRSAELCAQLRIKVPVYSLPAGDLLLNFFHYQNLLANSIIIAPSRSGATSEVLFSIRKAKQEFGCPCIGICARENSELSELADLILEIPWAFDLSVCQTRSVTNIYVANLLLIALMTRDKIFLKEIRNAVAKGEKFQKQNQKLLKQIARKNWAQVVILADGELEGIAQAGALSFKEIALVPSNYYHLLDVRHGPILLIDPKTLVIMVCAPEGIFYQKDLIKDLKKKKPWLLTLGPRTRASWNSDFHIEIPDYKTYAVWGIPFIFIPQVLSLYKALEKGLNPDLPQGLAPWITLREKKV